MLRKDLTNYIKYSNIDNVTDKGGYSMNNLIYKFWETSDLELVILELKELDKNIEFEEINKNLVFLRKKENIVGTLELINNIYHYNKI